MKAKKAVMSLSSTVSLIRSTDSMMEMTMIDLSTISMGGGVSVAMITPSESSPWGRTWSTS